MACPYPGPPCMTLKSSSNNTPLFIQNNAQIASSLPTDIAWKRKYFNNPIISEHKISARIWDINKKNILVEFKLIPEDENPLKNGYHLYLPVGLNNLTRESFVIYEFDDNEGSFEFKIQII